MATTSKSVRTRRSRHLLISRCSSTGDRTDARSRPSLRQIALSLGHEHQTAGFTGMVNACEALKPPDPVFRDHNIYHVTEELLGKARADMLQEEWFRPQAVRNAHLHRGEFRGSEFTQRVTMSSFLDPTFDQAWRMLAQITGRRSSNGSDETAHLSCCRSSAGGVGDAG